MKVKIIYSEERGTTELGWLHSRHSFSFAEYYNPKRNLFGALRVLNDDIVEPGEGFGMHNHANFEIVSIVLEGALEHKDSIGSHGVIKTHEIQRISAGTGITHSEFNPSTKEKVHFLQIWIKPKELGIQPSYEQKKFDFQKNNLTEIASGKRSHDKVYLHQDTYLSICYFDKGKKISYKLKNPNNGVFAFVIEGSIFVGNHKLKKYDSVEITDADEIIFKTEDLSKVLFIEVPMELSKKYINES